ncbi:MAG: Rap1a/Tai family immunity protein [Woeseiaceae bacterium]|nr:Rap1a/Tai family immunity protein [Woeseiaceae bacterium]
MTTRQLAGLVAAVIMLAMASAVHAVAPLSTEELTLHCAVYEDDPDGEDGIFCVRYIQGFIDGAVVTDERVTYNVADEADRAESFTERAIRTRVSSRVARYGPSVYADFCLGEPVPLREVVEVVVDNLLNTEFVRDMPLARDVVYATLRTTYPCEIDD